MGITMAVVDVLESHMDSSVVQHMKQSSSLQGGAVGAPGHSGPADPGWPPAPLTGSSGASYKPNGAGLEKGRWGQEALAWSQKVRVLCQAFAFVLPGLGTE